MAKPQILVKPRAVTLMLDEETVAYLLELARREGTNMSHAARRIAAEHRAFSCAELDQSEVSTPVDSAA